MPRLLTALKILEERGPSELAKKSIEVLAKSFGVGVSFGSYRPVGAKINNKPADTENIFEMIYRQNLWNSDESASGPGSELAYTAGYRRELINFLRERKINSFFDAPSGDLNWVGEIIDATRIEYVGGDISPTAVTLAKRRRPERDVRVFDICTDKFPKADVWHCRDCLFHLSFADIRRALDRFVASDIEYALITTNKAFYLKNIDIPTGAHRLVDLERLPIKLPKPMRYLKDFTKGADFPRYVGVLKRSEIADALQGSSWGLNQDSERGSESFLRLLMFLMDCH